MINAAMIPWLNKDSPSFPPIYEACDEPNGLLAAGGNLRPETLLSAYQQGIFPWYSEGEPILWWSPKPRCIIYPDQVHISSSMKKFIKKTKLRLTADAAFPDVIEYCSSSRHYTTDTWITREMKQAYLHMYELGHAHSVEAWHDKQLVGGLYGISIGQIFFGESMFSKQPNTSKFAFIKLCQILNQCNYYLIDCQVSSKHIHSLGASNMPQADFANVLKKYTELQPSNCPWTMHNHYE